MKQPINKTALRKAGGPAKNPPVKTTGALKAKSSMPSAVAPDRKWEVESAMNTLMRAEDLKRDPKMMADVKKLAAEQAAKMAAVCKK